MPTPPGLQPTGPSFALFAQGDAYSTAQRMMGRQSAGQSLVQGVARTWPQGTVQVLAGSREAALELAQQLQATAPAVRTSVSLMPNPTAAVQAGVLYCPAPATRDLAHLRSSVSRAAYSLMGVTHTLSSAGAQDHIGDHLFPPFEPWDALICTSQAARRLVQGLHEELGQYWRQTTGVQRLNTPQLPVIPLGVNVPAHTRTPQQRATARARWALADDEVVFLFAGRLSFHAKANPAPVYQALQAISAQGRVVCLEAGQYHNRPLGEAFEQARRALAPQVRFVWADGADAQAYGQAWQAADVFVSLSDNIQETFGLTPVEAMAAGLPVVVSDWDGYKDTVRDGVDGFRIPTVLPPAGAGGDLALRHGLGLDTYDYFIGRVSHATVIEPTALQAALGRLLREPGLRQAMGQAGAQRAALEFDWPVVLRRYEALAQELKVLRPASAQALGPAPWPQRADPFHRFAHFPSRTLSGDQVLAAAPQARARLAELSTLSIFNYALSDTVIAQADLHTLLDRLQHTGGATVNQLLQDTGLSTPKGIRALMCLWKFGLIQG